MVDVEGLVTTIFFHFKFQLIGFKSFPDQRSYDIKWEQNESKSNDCYTALSTTSGNLLKSFQCSMISIAWECKFDLLEKSGYNVRKILIKPLF